MKVRQQLIYDAKRLAGVQKYFGFGLSSRNRLVATFIFFGGILERSHDCGSDCEHGALFAAGAGQSDGRGLGNFIRLGMDRVVFEAFGADRLESAEPDVECDFGDLDAARANPRDDFRREVQSRCGSGDRAPFSRENSLIALAIRRLIRSFDVRRQRNVAEMIYGLAKAVSRRESDDAQAIVASALDCAFEFPFAENDSLADRDFSARPHKRLPGVGADLADEEDFDRGLEEFAALRVISPRRLGMNSGAAAEKACGKDARIVDDDEFVAAQQIGQFAERSGLPRRLLRGRGAAFARRRDLREGAGRFARAAIRNRSRLRSLKDALTFAAEADLATHCRGEDAALKAAALHLNLTILRRARRFRRLLSFPSWMRPLDASSDGPPR